MYHRRSQGDSKPTNGFAGSLSSPSTTHFAQSTPSLQSSTTGRVSIYSMRERVILNKMTRIMGKLAPDAETEVSSRFHQEIPAIRLDGYLTYSLYITIQNLIHLNIIYILFYHAVFWLNSSKSQTFQSFQKLDKTDYEQTLFAINLNHQDDGIRPTINVHLIDTYVYLTLVWVSSIELIAAFLWTLQKKLSYFIQRSQKWRNRSGLLLIGIIFIFYLTFLAWLSYHTFITHHLTSTIFGIVLSHFVFLTLLDKPNLFRDSSVDSSSKSFSTSNITRKQQRHSASSLSSAGINSTSRLSYRPSTSTQPRRINSIINSLFSSSGLSSRWSSVIEQKLDIHKCSTFYAETREEADDLWPMVVRRMALKFYRTFASFILFDLIPFITTDGAVRTVDYQQYQILIIIFALSTFLTHSVFLFPIKFQTNLHRLATHLGQWRSQLCIRTDTINEWSSECNSYTRGSVIKLPSNNEKHFIAIQHLSNAAYPQSISHSILYRLFGETTFFLALQVIICMVLVLCELFWMIRGQFWHEILITVLIILNSSYTIFKIIRGRFIFDMIDDNETDEILLTSKQKKSN